MNSTYAEVCNMEEKTVQKLRLIKERKCFVFFSERLSYRNTEILRGQEMRTEFCLKRQA